MSVIGAGIKKMHARIAKRENPDQTASLGQTLCFLSRSFLLPTSALNVRTSTVCLLKT